MLYFREINATALNMHYILTLPSWQVADVTLSLFQVHFSIDSWWRIDKGGAQVKFYQPIAFSVSMTSPLVSGLDTSSMTYTIHLAAH